MRENRLSGWMRDGEQTVNGHRASQSVAARLFYTPEQRDNWCENAMRPVALGHKNWLHIDSAEAGPRIAAITSVIETCRRLGISAREYLLDVLAKVPTWLAKRIAELTPMAWAAQRPSRKRGSLAPVNLQLPGIGMTHTLSRDSQVAILYIFLSFTQPTPSRPPKFYSPKTVANSLRWPE